MPLSVGLLRETEQYFDALGAFREGDAGPIVNSFAQATLFAVAVGRELLNEILNYVSEGKDDLDGTGWTMRLGKFFRSFIRTPFSTYDSSRHRGESRQLLLAEDWTCWLRRKF